jgi:hypothetical protein
MTLVETDYLVVGAGMAGMGFVDSLLDVTDAEVVMVDRRHEPGGHWLDAYPFVRLHQPSPWYGVASTVLGNDHLETDGPEAGHYTRASGVEIRAYFAAVMRERFLASGRVRFLPMTDHVGDGRLRSRLGGEVTEVRARRGLVDATYTSSRTPESFPPPFEVAEGVHLVTPAELTRLEEPPEGFVVVGTGKTAMDTCGWLLEQGCPPDRITWVRTRDAWLNNRHFLQPDRLAALTVEGTVGFLEALATSETEDQVFEHLERVGVLLRIDPDVWPTVFRGPTISEHEVQQLRRIQDVVRLGRVLRVEPGRIVLEHGEVPTSPDRVHVHCAAPGLPDAPPRPVFEEDRITVQYLSRVNMPLSSAVIARVEALELPLAEKNRLCPANFVDDSPLGYVQMLLKGLASEGLWRRHPDLAPWFATTRVNATRDRPDAPPDPAREALYVRLLEAIEPAYASLARLTAEPAG